MLPNEVTFTGATITSKAENEDEPVLPTKLPWMVGLNIQASWEAYKILKTFPPERGEGAHSTAPLLSDGLNHPQF